MKIAAYMNLNTGNITIERDTLHSSQYLVLSDQPFLDKSS